MWIFVVVVVIIAKRSVVIGITVQMQLVFSYQYIIKITTTNVAYIFTDVVVTTSSAIIALFFVLNKYNNCNCKASFTTLSKVRKFFDTRQPSQFNRVADVVMAGQLEKRKQQQQQQLETSNKTIPFIENGFLFFAVVVVVVVAYTVVNRNKGTVHTFPRSCKHYQRIATIKKKKKFKLN